MDSKVQAKVPENRRTKYIIVGLIAVICVLSYQLHREHNAKKEIVRRKTFLVGKLHEYRVASEKSETKYKDMRIQKNVLQAQYDQLATRNKGLAADLSDKQKAHEETSEQLQSVQKLADGSKASLAELTVNYDNAMSSVKTMEGKLEHTISVCDKHKENSQSLNQSIAEKTRLLGTCKQEKMVLEQEKQVLVESEQDLRRKIEDMGKVKTALLGGLQDQAQSNVPQGQHGVQSPVVGQIPQASYVTSQSSQNQGLPGAQSSQTVDQRRAMLRKSFAPSANQVTPSFQRPTTAQQTA